MHVAADALLNYDSNETFLVSGGSVLRALQTITERRRKEECGDGRLLRWSVKFQNQQHLANYCFYIWTGSWMMPFHPRGSVLMQDVPMGVMRSWVHGLWWNISTAWAVAASPQQEEDCLLSTSGSPTAVMQWWNLAQKHLASNSLTATPCSMNVLAAAFCFAGP